MRNEAIHSLALFSVGPYIALHNTYIFYFKCTFRLSQKIVRDVITLFAHNTHYYIIDRQCCCCCCCCDLLFFFKIYFISNFISFLLFPHLLIFFTQSHELCRLTSNLCPHCQQPTHQFEAQESELERAEDGIYRESNRLDVGYKK